MLDKSTIAETLKRYRVLKGWTQGQLGKKLGIQAPSVSKMERNQYRWTDLTIARIMRKIPDLCHREHSPENRRGIGR